MKTTKSLQQTMTPLWLESTHDHVYLAYNHPFPVRNRFSHMQKMSSIRKYVIWKIQKSKGNYFEIVYRRRDSFEIKFIYWTFLLLSKMILISVSPLYTSFILTLTVCWLWAQTVIMKNVIENDKLNFCCCEDTSIEIEIARVFLCIKPSSLYQWPKFES